MPTSVLPSADLTITSVTPSVTTSYPTGTVTYTITAKNNGPSDSTGGTIADSIPGLASGQATFVSASNGTTLDSTTGVVTFTFGTLASGSFQTFTVTVSPTDQAVNQALGNSATIASSDNEHDPNLANNTLASTPVNVIPAVTLVAGLSGSPKTVQVGDPLTYTATVRNSSGVDATGVTLVDTLPSNVVIVSAPPGRRSPGTRSPTRSVACRTVRPPHRGDRRLAHLRRPGQPDADRLGPVHGQRGPAQPQPGPGVLHQQRDRPPGDRRVRGVQLLRAGDRRVGHAHRRPHRRTSGEPSRCITPPSR